VLDPIIAPNVSVAGIIDTPDDKPAAALRRAAVFVDKNGRQSVSTEISEGPLPGRLDDLLAALAIEVRLRVDSGGLISLTGTTGFGASDLLLLAMADSPHQTESSPWLRELVPMSLRET
jgi:hypothetical protein